MGQITLYLDAETEQIVRSSAKAAGLSQSRWVANLIRATRTEWPHLVRKLAGAWEDFPTAEELRAEVGANDQSP